MYAFLVLTLQYEFYHNYVFYYSVVLFSVCVYLVTNRMFTFSKEIESRFRDNNLCIIQLISAFGLSIVKKINFLVVRPLLKLFWRFLLVMSWSFNIQFRTFYIEKHSIYVILSTLK